MEYDIALSALNLTGGLHEYVCTRCHAGLLAPANTPKDIIGKLAAETARVLKLPDVGSRLSELGAEPVGGTPEQFAAHIKSEIAKWAKVIKEANVELQ